MPGPSWAFALVAAAVVTLFGTPVLRGIAVATEFVDHPVASHKSHTDPTPYLGGVGLIVAVLIGMLFTSTLTSQVEIVALGGSLIGCLGLLDDHRSVSALFRTVVELGVASLALAAGLRIHATDIGPLDGAITLVWIVGVTNAVNLLDNMDGLAAGVSAAAAAAIFALAVLGEQPATATVAAALAGACVGFLAHNKRPASIFMGDTGSLFLGFVLAVTAISVSPALTPPTSFAVPLMLLALPVLDTTTVTLARIRHGLSVSQGGKDHLSHRLVALGLSPGIAVAVLVAVEAAVGLFAVLAGRDVIDLSVAVVATVIELAVLGAVVLQADVYRERVVGLPRRLRLAAGAGIVGLVVLAAPAAVAMLRAHGPGIAGATAARQGLDAVAAGDGGRGAALFAEADGRLGDAQRLLHGPMTSLGLLLPGVRANLATTRALVGAGLRVTRSAENLAAAVQAPQIPLGPSSDSLGQAARLAPALEASATALQRSVAELAGYDRPYLWPSLATAVTELRTTLGTASSRVGSAAQIARLAPGLLGQDGTRRYFVAVQDNTELRGGGGVIRAWGEVEVTGGRRRLSRFGSIEQLNASGPLRTLDGLDGFADRYRLFDPANTWENVNVSPDFAVTGQVITRLYPESGGAAVDGVIGLDLPGLAGLLRVTGPITVAGWPVPVTSDNAVDILVHQAPLRFPVESDRQAFLAAVAQGTIESFLAADLGSPARLAASLGDAVGDGHLLLYAGRADDEAMFDRLGAAGRVPPVTGDSLLVVNQNLSGKGVDGGLVRAVHYDVDLDPGRKPATVSARVDVSLRNDATVENRTYLSIYSPFGLATASPELAPAPELGRRSYSTTVTVPAQQSRTVTVDVAGRLQLDAGGWYRLGLPRQGSLAGGETEVSLSVPSGWRIIDVRGPVRPVDSRHATAQIATAGDAELSVRLQRTPWARLWARIRP